MVKHFCDICMREIRDDQKCSRYKVKRLVYGMFDPWWENLIVHDECWEALGKYIGERRSGDE